MQVFLRYGGFAVVIFKQIMMNFKQITLKFKQITLKFNKKKAINCQKWKLIVKKRNIRVYTRAGAGFPLGFPWGFPWGWLGAGLGLGWGWLGLAGAGPRTEGG